MAEELQSVPEEDDDRRRSSFDEPPKRVLNLAEKLRLLFDYEFPGAHGVRIQAVWAAGEVLEFGGDFNKYVTSKSLQKQEGVVFRHLLRLILLVNEFVQLCPPDVTEEEWRGDLTRATDRDAGTPLPRIAPMRLGATLAWTQGPWGARFGLDHAAAQDRVPPGSRATAGYTLWNDEEGPPKGGHERSLPVAGLL